MIAKMKIQNLVTKSFRILGHIYNPIYQTDMSNNLRNSCGGWNGRHGGVVDLKFKNPIKSPKYNIIFHLSPRKHSKQGM